MSKKVFCSNCKYIKKRSSYDFSCRSILQHKASKIRESFYGSLGGFIYGTGDFAVFGSQNVKCTHVHGDII